MIFKNDKYEILEHGESLTIGKSILHRIRALKDFGDVKAGDIGGWVEDEFNLSKEGNCWVYNDAKVYGHAHIRDNVKVIENASVYGEVYLFENCLVAGFADMHDKSGASDNAIIRGNMYEDAKARGQAEIYPGANVHGKCFIREYAIVMDTAEVFGESCISGHAIVKGKVFGQASVKGNASIGRMAKIHGSTIIDGDIFIDSDVSINGFNITISGRNGYINGKPDEMKTDWRKEEEKLIKDYYPKIGADCSRYISKKKKIIGFFKKIFHK